MRYLEKNITGYATGYNSSGSYSSSYPWSNISNAFDWSSTVSPTQTGTSYWRGTYASIKIYQYSNSNDKNFLKGIKNYKCCLNENFEDAYDGTGTEYLNFSCIPSDSEITQFKFKVRSSIGKYHNEAIRYFKNSKDVTTNGSNSEGNFALYKKASSSGIAVTENMNYNDANTDGHVFLKNSSGNFVFAHMNYHIGQWTIDDFKNGYFLPQVFWGPSSSSAGTNYCYPRGFSVTLTVKIPVYTISTSVSGQGTVTGGGEYISERVATLTATPSSGYVFKQWNDGNTSQTRTVVSSGDITYTAIFEPTSFNVSFKNQDGTIIENRIFETSSTLGTLPTVSRVGYTFAGWIPCAPAKKVDGNILDSQKYSNNSFNALSQQYKYTNNLSIHIEAYMENWMDIVNSQIISCTEGGGWGLGYLANTVGHGFEIHTGSYSGFDLGFGTEGQFSNDSWHSFDIIFSNGIFDIYIDGEKKGSQTASSSTISYNSSNTIFVGAEAGANTTTPTGSYFNGIISNVFIANQNSKLEFATPNTIIDRSIDYYPVWRLNPTYAITTKAEPSDGGTVSGNGNYTKGTTITLTAVPNPGYRFIQWSDDSISNPRTLIVNTSKEYTAIFEKNNITIGDVSFKTIMCGDKPVMIFVGNQQLY